MGTEFQFHKMKRSLGMDGDGCLTVCMYLMPLNYIHLQMVKIVTFV